MTMHDNFHYILSVEPYTFFLCSQSNPTPFFFTSIYCQSNPIPFFLCIQSFLCQFRPSVIEHSHKQNYRTYSNKQTTHNYIIIEHPQTNTHHTHTSTIYTERHTHIDGQYTQKGIHTERSTGQTYTEHASRTRSPSKWDLHRNERTYKNE